MKTLCLITILSLSACAPVTTTAPSAQPATTSPANAVHFSAERVSPGTIRLALDNGATQPIGYNLCTSELQYLSGSEWRAVPTDEFCTMQLLSLNPGADATFEKKLPAGLVSGEYRYVTGVEIPIGTAATRIATIPFRH